jgi:hypothetical protein
LQQDAEQGGVAELADGAEDGGEHGRRLCGGGAGVAGFWGGEASPGGLGRGGALSTIGRFGPYCPRW